MPFKTDWIKILSPSKFNSERLFNILKEALLNLFSDFLLFTLELADRSLFSGGMCEKERFGENCNTGTKFRRLKISELL
jgi:hypothetical protein